MKKPFIFMVIAILLLGMISVSPAYAQDKITFRAKVSELGLQARWVEKGKSDSDEIKLTLPGKLYDQPLKVQPISKDKANLSTPIAALTSDFSAFKAEDKAWITDNFVPDERDELKVLFDDAELWDRSRKAMQDIPRLLVYGYCYYKQYVFVFYRFSDKDGLAVASVFKKTEKVWKRTNKLSGDETFDIVWSAFRIGQVAPAAK